MKRLFDPGRWPVRVAAAFLLILAWYGASVLEFSDPDDVEVPVASQSSAGDTDSRLVSSQIGNSRERVILSMEPPYLVELPILDENLYIEYYYNNFLFGGVDLHLIRYSAWARSGGVATSIDREDYIEFEMSEQPYIEFSYKGKYYSIEVIERLYFYRMELRELAGPTIALNSRFAD